MVVVFFVLSGYVLSLPALGRGIHWLSAGYPVRRMIRLYVPVWGALLLAAILRALFARHTIPGGGSWLNAHVQRLVPTEALHAASVVHQTNNWALTTVIWSLKWEVLFSLLLPVAVLIPLASRKRPGLAFLAACLSLVGVLYGFGHDVGWLKYLPIFELGALLAFHGHRWSVRRRGVWLALAGAGSCLLCSTYMFENEGATAGWGVPEIADILGAALLVWCAAQPPATAMLDRRPVRWLGSRSYTLYLIHEPIIVTFVFVLGMHPGAVLLAWPVVLIAGELIYRGVERPSVQAARRAGALVERGLALTPLPRPRQRTAGAERY